MLEILTDVLNYILNSCEWSKGLILLRSVLRHLSTVPRRCQGPWFFRRGKYSRRRRPFAKLVRWARGWFFDALFIFGGSAVLAIMCVSFFS